MKDLGSIKISIMCDIYNMQFYYAMPKKIDFFTLVLFEVIKHLKSFNDNNFEESLLMLDIPRDLHYIFNERLTELMSNPVMVNCTSQEQTNNLLKPVRSYSLTQSGEEAYNSKEMIEEPRNLSKEYIYDTINNSFIQRSKANISDSQDTIMVEMQTPSENEVKNLFTREITENPKKFIKDAGPETKIYNLTAALISKVGIQKNIKVFINDGKLKFDNENKNILKAFLSVNAEEKKSIRKMFNYLDIPQTKVNFDKAGLVINRSHKIKMKIAFGKRAAFEAVADADRKFEMNMNIYKDISDFCFAGITNGDKTLIYNYCEITDQGYTLPLEEFDYSEQNYNAIFSSVFKACIADIAKDINLDELISFAILASPPERRTSVAKSIMEQTKDLMNALKKAKIIFKTAEGYKSINDTVKDSILDLIKVNLSNGGIDADSVIGIMKEIDLPKERTIKIVAEGSYRTDKTINALLAVDEAATIRIYELGKLYNSLLKNGKLQEIKHNTNLYSAFLDYDRQYKKLQTFGFKNYYEYNIPKNWDEFIKEVYILRSMFNGIKDKLESDIIKQASDFFTRVQDDYDALAPIDKNVVKKLPGNNDLQLAINSPKIDVSQIAFAIRSKYEEALRTLEKAKDPKTTGDRKGKELIRYTVEPKSVDEVYRHWRNLNILMRKETTVNELLWKVSEEDRRKALNSALNYFNQKFISKEQKR